MRNVIGGLAVIGLGLLLGNSVFLGDTDSLAIIFDGVGVGLIVWGVVQMASGKG